MNVKIQKEPRSYLTKRFHILADARGGRDPFVFLNSRDTLEEALEILPYYKRRREMVYLFDSHKRGWVDPHIPKQFRTENG